MPIPYRDRKEYYKEYYKKNKEYIDKRKRRWCIKRTYGITIEQYNEMLISQNGMCLICGKEETRTRKKKVTQLVVDHSHKTGKVRGLLCAICNGRLGWYEKCQEKIKSYLKNN